MIGIFDSGVGGLSILRAVRAQLPRAELLYLGDNAHIPYGPRPLAARRAIGLVFQEPSLDDRLTAWENLLLHAFLYGVPGRERAGRMREVLSLVELSEVFLTTHYMDEAEHADRIPIMDRGQIAALDTPARLKDRVGGDVVALKTVNDEAAADELRQRFGLKVDRQNGNLHLTPADKSALTNARSRPTAAKPSRRRPTSRFCCRDFNRKATLGKPFSSLGPPFFMLVVSGGVHDPAGERAPRFAVVLAAA